MVKWLSEQRADNQEENKDGTSPLGIAAQYEHVEVAKWLKEQAVGVGEKDRNLDSYATGNQRWSSG